LAHWEKKPFESVMGEGVVAAVATSGASMASRLPVTLGDVETIRLGLLLSSVVPFSCLISRGHRPAEAPEASGPPDDAPSPRDEQDTGNMEASATTPAVRMREIRVRMVLLRTIVLDASQGTDR